MSAKGIVALVVVVAIVVVGVSSLYYVDEREKAIVFKFGEIIRSDAEPGLHVKTPFINSVRYFDYRIQTMDSDAELYLTQEKKNLVVDSFAKWRISDVARYYVSVGGNPLNAENRLAQLVNDGLRAEFGKRTVQEVISGDRRLIMDIVREQTNNQAKQYGIDVIDVRLKRVDLVEEVSERVYQRMEAERSRVAKELRAQGAEAAERIRAEADRQREIIIAEAFREAEQLRGEGDATATAVYAEAYGADRDFYALYRSLDAYQNTFYRPEDFLVLSPDSEFFRFFKQPHGERPERGLLAPGEEDPASTQLGMDSATPRAAESNP